MKEFGSDSRLESAVVIVDISKIDEEDRLSSQLLLEIPTAMSIIVFSSVFSRYRLTYNPCVPASVSPEL